MPLKYYAQGPIRKRGRPGKPIRDKHGVTLRDLDLSTNATNKRCMSCNRLMPAHPTWRTQCKDCDPVRTVD